MLMKGIVLAGGTGSRLFPLTKITNKHLLPIYDRPMIYYPIQTLVDAGIEDIMVVTGGRNSGDFLRLLANGKEFGLKHINYTYQEGEGGIADALALAEHFADGQKICVILGDNIIEGNIRDAAERFRSQARGAHILLKEVADAERFGVAEVSGRPHRRHRGETQAPEIELRRDRHLHVRLRRCSIRSRPWCPPAAANWKSPTSTTPILREGRMTFSFLDGWWTDAGTFDSLLRAANLVKESVTGGTAAEEHAEGAVRSLMAGSDGDVGAASGFARRTWNWRSRECAKGIGAVIGAVDSPELHRGRARRAVCRLPGRPRLLSGSAAPRPRPGARLSARPPARFRRR